MRLTKPVRQQLLAQNEGFETRTTFRARNFDETRHYTIRDGLLHVRATGKGAWADSRYDQEFIADEATTHKFLRDNLARLDSTGLK